MSILVKCPKCGGWWSVTLIEKKLIRAKFSKDTAQNLKNGSTNISKICTKIEQYNNCHPLITISTRLAGLILSEAFEHFGRNLLSKKYYCRKCKHTFVLEIEIDTN